jgi:hypothetical protein
VICVTKCDNFARPSSNGLQVLSREPLYTPWQVQEGQGRRGPRQCIQRSAVAAAAADVDRAQPRVFIRLLNAES